MKKPNYTNYADYYDYFELAGYDESEEVNLFLSALFRDNKLNKILDFSCGTGAQTIGLAKKGFNITANDICLKMIQLAKAKAKLAELNSITFLNHDMLNLSFKKSFDAAISMFNSIGHLTTRDCQSFFISAFNSLKKGGIFVTDILNFTALNKGVFEEYRYSSKEYATNNKLIHHVKSCNLNTDNQIIEVSSITRIQDGINSPITNSDYWEMQIYTASDLKKMLKTAGFGEILFFSAAGAIFEEEVSDNILAVCQKPIY